LTRCSSSQQLSHQVQANGVVTQLAQALRATRGAALLEWRGQRRCAQVWGELVRPDGYLRLQLAGGRLELWLECDRATEPHQRLQDKLDRYEELALALERPVALLLTLPGERREREVQRALRSTADVLLLTTTAQRHRTDPLTRNWLAPGGERRLSLCELATRAATRPRTRHRSTTV
jgi:hypothetical protein